MFIYLCDHDIAEVERSRMESNQHFIVGELRERLLCIELEIVEAALTLNGPTLCHLWQRHNEDREMI